MDGTLTPARQPMTPDFSRRFLPWLKSHLAYLAAGSNYEKVTEQLPPDAVAAFSGIYSSMGNVYHQKGLEVYRNEIVLKRNFSKRWNVFAAIPPIRESCTAIILNCAREC